MAVVLCIAACLSADETRSQGRGSPSSGAAGQGLLPHPAGLAHHSTVLQLLG